MLIHYPYHKYPSAEVIPVPTRVTNQPLAFNQPRERDVAPW